MKLRNKKTGCIEPIYSIVVRRAGEFHCDYSSMKELLECWEDPPEPLIKDEKIRKAVRAWAEAIHSSHIKFDRYIQGFSVSGADMNILSMINFEGVVFDLSDGQVYHINELCGDEK